MRPKSGPNPNADRRYRIYHDKDGVPVSVRSAMPFYEKSFTDEAGYEVLECYYLVFDFEVGGLMVEVTRTWTDVEYSYDGFLELHQLDGEAREALLRLMRSGKLEEMRAKVLEAAQEALEKIAQVTDIPSEADSLEKEVHRIFEQVVKQVVTGARQA